MSVPQVSVDDLLVVIDDAFVSVIDEPTDGMADWPAGVDDTVSAGVDISGPWNGQVVLTSSLAGAAQFSAEMLRMDVADVTVDDMRDAVGELANILGGTVKATLGCDCLLSLPWFRPGTVDAATSPVVSVAVTWRGLPLQVAVLVSDV